MASYVQQMRKITLGEADTVRDRPRPGHPCGITAWGGWTVKSQPSPDNEALALTTGVEAPPRIARWARSLADRRAGGVRS